MKKRGRPLEWPAAWTEFSELVGGPAALRDALGYTSATTVPDKVHGRSPWSKADRLLLAHLCRENGFDFSRLSLEPK
jgi:hypothetical protein